jgi:hypothetical protein
MTLLLVDWDDMPSSGHCRQREDARICAYAVRGLEPEFCMLCYLIYIYWCYIDHETACARALCAICRGQALASSMVRGDRDPMHMSQEQAQKASLACCAILTKYNNAIWMTKPHSHTLCVRFTEVSKLSNALNRQRRLPQPERHKFRFSTK